MALAHGGLKRMQETQMFSENMKEAQKAAMEKRWEDFKKHMMENQANILTEFDLLGNNSIHIATRSHPQLLKEMIQMVPEAEKWPALCKQNREGNSVLHEIVFSEKAKEMAEVVFKFEELLMEEQRPLLELRNNRGESPLFVAAMHGNLKILKHMAKRVGDMDNLRQHFRRSDQYNALHASVIGQHFHVAIWLQRKDETLALERDEKQLTSLQLLSKMPQVFRSHIHLGLVKSVIYNLLPVEENGKEEEPDEENGREEEPDEENGKEEEPDEENGREEEPDEENGREEEPDEENGREEEPDEENGREEEPEVQISAISKINYSFWKRLAAVFEGIDHMWKEKKKYMLAEQLASTLVKYDLSWQVSNNNEYNRTLLIAMPRNPLNMTKRRRVSVQKGEERCKNTEERPEHTALFIATKTGIVEIVQKFLEVYPASIYHVTKNKQNILTMAVKYRQKKILKIIERTGTMELLVGQITKKGRTVLHEVARMNYYKAEGLAGVAFHLQDELRWYDTVRRFTPKHYNMHPDINGHTPEDILEIEHDGILKEAQKWLKETAQSCSTVIAILIATVVFSAAYPTEGGHEYGIDAFPVNEFLFFTIMDVVALATSLASVVVFLFILTSPCKLWDFHKYLPRALKLGFALFFISLIATMLAFSETFLLTSRYVRMGHRH